MRVLLYCIVFACVLVLAAGCATTRWSLYDSRISTTEENGEERGASNTILLDGKTGDTWVLWPNRTGYEWKELPK